MAVVLKHNRQFQVETRARANDVLSSLSSGLPACRSPRLSRAAMAQKPWEELLWEEQPEHGRPRLEQGPVRPCELSGSTSRWWLPVRVTAIPSAGRQGLGRGKGQSQGKELIPLGLRLLQV